MSICVLHFNYFFLAHLPHLPPHLPPSLVCFHSNTGRSSPVFFLRVSFRWDSLNRSKTRECNLGIFAGPWPLRKGVANAGLEEQVLLHECTLRRPDPEALWETAMQKRKHVCHMGNSWLLGLPEFVRKCGTSTQKLRF